MRLIDADALLENQPKDCCRTSNWINAAPTIYAIPVDWLREKMRGYASTLKSTELSAVVRVMQMWDKEQEAQDG